MYVPRRKSVDSVSSEMHGAECPNVSTLYKRNTIFLFQVQAAPYFYVQHIPGNVCESKSREML